MVQQILPGLKWFRVVLTGAAAVTGLGAQSVVAQEIEDTQLLTLQCGIFYALLAEQADPAVAGTMEAYSDAFFTVLEAALTESGLSEKQQGDLSARHAAPIASALAEGTDPDVALHQCAGIYVDIHGVDLAVFQAAPELHPQFTCGAAFLLAEEDPSAGVTADDMHVLGIALLDMAYETLAAAGVDDLAQYAITQGYTVNISQALSPDGDGDIGYTLEECLDLIAE